MNGRRIVAAIAAAVGVALCASCGSTTVSSTGGPAARATSTATDPLATSLTADGATWATVPMGHIGEALNTFWQLVALPSGSSSWKLETPPGIATNGGLVTSGTPSRLLVGVLPANLLHFSTVVATSNRGTAWIPGVLPSALAASPDALTDSGAGADALLRGSKQRVVHESKSLSSWAPVTDVAAALDGGPTLRACNVGAITAIGPGTAGAPLLGVACRRRGVAGILRPSGRTWQLDGPKMPGATADASATVLRLIPSGTGVAALVAATSASGTALVAAWDTRGTWDTTAPLRLSPAGPLRATGPANSGGLWVLTGGTHPKLYLGDRAHHWTALPSPPTTTRTVAFPTTATGRGGGAYAFAVSGSVLSVWHLDPGAGHWTKTEKIDVPIQYGSSG